MSDLVPRAETDESTATNQFDNQPTLLDETDVNYLIQTEDGKVEYITKSRWTTLTIEYGLWDIFQTGDTVWTNEGGPDEPGITLFVEDGAMEYTLSIEDGGQVHLGEHHKTKLVQAFDEMYTEYDKDTVIPLINLYDELRDGMIRDRVLNPIGEAFDSVEIQSGGWYINGHLLLTWEGDFYHPDTVSRRRSGSVINDGANENAYEIRSPSPSSDQERSLTIEGKTYRLTDSEMEFLAMATWAIGNTPDRKGE